MYENLIHGLKHANAAEHGAVWAYRGHRASLRKRPFEYRQLGIIIDEERYHIYVTKRILADFGEKPSWFFVGVFSAIGMILGLGCFLFGYRLPMKVAGIIERMGRKGYKELAKVAKKDQQNRIALKLMEMADVEDEHSRFFDEKEKSDGTKSKVPSLRR